MNNGIQITLGIVDTDAATKIILDALKPKFADWLFGAFCFGAMSAVLSSFLFNLFNLSK